MARVVIAVKVPLKRDMDSFAPRFGDLLAKGGSYFDETTYMNSVMMDSPEIESKEAKQNLDSHLRVLVSKMAVERVPTKRAMMASLEGNAPTITLNEAYPHFPDTTHDVSIDTRVVGPTVVTKAAQSGVCLMELCGGICTGLEALLRSGVRVNQYLYVDKDPLAQEMARFRLGQMSAKYPTQFPLAAWEHAFQMPQDLTKVEDHHVSTATAPKQAHRQWFIIAGWPCQDYSPAGKGKQGERAALLCDLVRVIRMMQELFASSPPAYILENVPMQHNFRHNHIRFPVFEEVCKFIGRPVELDSARVGSRAHRLRNYWTNLAEPDALSRVLGQIDQRASGPLDQILGEGRESMPVLGKETTQSGLQVNQPGEPRRVFPTFTSYPMSRAFRLGKRGSVFDRNEMVYTEPNAEERERAMGYEEGAKRAPTFSEKDRCKLLRQYGVRASYSLSAVNPAHLSGWQLLYQHCQSKPMYVLLKASQMIQMALPSLSTKRRESMTSGGMSNA